MLCLHLSSLFSVANYYSYYSYYYGYLHRKEPLEVVELASPIDSSKTHEGGDEKTGGWSRFTRALSSSIVQLVSPRSPRGGNPIDDGELPLLPVYA